MIAPALRLTKFGPMTAADCSGACVGCGRPFAPGDFTAHIAIGPAPDPVARQQARQGLMYRMAVVEVCWPCATGEENG